jgi:hypothetical protein
VLTEFVNRVLTGSTEVAYTPFNVHVEVLVTIRRYAIDTINRNHYFGASSQDHFEYLSIWSARSPRDHNLTDVSAHLDDPLDPSFVSSLQQHPDHDCHLLSPGELIVLLELQLGCTHLSVSDLLPHPQA